MSSNYLLDDLEGKVAIVTGAASGVGSAVVRRLVDCGVSVIAEDINTDVEGLFGDVDAVTALIGDATTNRPLWKRHNWHSKGSASSTFWSTMPV